MVQCQPATCWRHLAEEDLLFCMLSLLPLARPAMQAMGTRVSGPVGLVGCFCLPRPLCSHASADPRVAALPSGLQAARPADMCVCCLLMQAARRVRALPACLGLLPPVAQLLLLSCMRTLCCAVCCCLLPVPSGPHVASLAQILTLLLHCFCCRRRGSPGEG